ncbi:MAG: hypothetical protein K5905_22600 [Roseibium sp.]|uniref:hypothetical protein n=1 Tax=Roseibium sp. TaxID=1936156 RepID=UPI002637C5DC|nr:hypothetical protein [Roseibium sp.]MCV0428256.1 hypothetical protein [Roseibium sp.]
MTEKRLSAMNKRKNVSSLFSLCVFLTAYGYSASPVSAEECVYDDRSFSPGALICGCTILTEAVTSDLSNNNNTGLTMLSQALQCELKEQRAIWIHQQEHPNCFKITIEGTNLKELAPIAKSLLDLVGKQNCLNWNTPPTAAPPQ